MINLAIGVRSVGQLGRARSTFSRDEGPNHTTGAETSHGPSRDRLPPNPTSGELWYDLRHRFDVVRRSFASEPSRSARLMSHSLPSAVIPQAKFDDLPELDSRTLHARRERLLLLFAGVFLGAMAMLNILGITKFLVIAPAFEFLGVAWSPVVIAVGVLPYPLTFLCTDFISEFYGQRCANWVVFVGLLVNLLVLGVLSLGARIDGVDQPAPFQVFLEANGDLEPARGEDGAELRDESGAPVLRVPEGAEITFTERALFERIALTTQMAVFASMIAYLAAQFVDVFMFHFWKRLTRGRHLWLRNNGSTLVSQLVDTTLVVAITFGGSVADGTRTVGDLAAIVGWGYLFKVVVALVDTVPFYFGVHHLSRFLRIDSAAQVEDPEKARA